MSKGPARIRISFSRPLSYAEQEFFHGKIDLVSVTDAKTSVTARLNGNQKLWLESNSYDSRQLYQFGRELVESNFVNVFPVAVRTFRELA